MKKTALQVVICLLILLIIVLSKAFLKPIYSFSIVRQRIFPTSSRVDLGSSINKKVYLLIYDPILRNGQRLSEYKKWKPYIESANEAIDFFKKVSNNRVNFSIVYKHELNAWPKKQDGFIYDEDSYLAVINGTSQPHRPDIADYYQFLNDQTLDICGKFNRGEIDELWTFAGPWFGFWESALATSANGPAGFWYNGPTYNQTSCGKLLPVGIPGPHTFGHRAEATMTFVYGSWQENRTVHNWDKYGLEKAHSPDFNVFGCGSVHYAPNSQSESDDYDFNLSDTVLSYCDDFYNYPNLKNPILSARPINCEEWGCSTSGYEEWWWKHLPRFSGWGPDGKLNDWWQYIMDPNKVYESAVVPSATLTPTVPKPSIWPTISNIILPTIAPSLTPTTLPWIRPTHPLFPTIRAREFVS